MFKVYNHFNAGQTLEQLPPTFREPTLDEAEEQEAKKLVEQMRHLKHVFLRPELFNNQTVLMELAKKYLKLPDPQWKVITLV